MKTKNRVLAGVLCLLMIASSFVGLTSCDFIPEKEECSHQWGEWSTTKKATCTTAGAKERQCEDCDEKETASIDALGHDWNEATCSAPKKCKVCSVTEGAALAHSFTVETVSDKTLKTAATCDSPAVYYKSCACGAISTKDADTFVNGSALDHKDENSDHVCDNNCGKIDMGAHSDSNTDKDHVCDYGCGATLEECSDAANDGDHTCDLCGKENVSDHLFGNATCETSSTCSDCGELSDPAFGHKDENKDHACDICGTPMGEHADTNKDHDCDYGCDKPFGEHTDGDDDDHLCDYGCEKIADEGCYDTVVDGKCDECGVDIDHPCVDENKNHACDICSKSMGEHTDPDKDHNCDYGCADKIGTCEDADFDHKCDYGCNRFLGTCEDTNKDHECDHGCKKTFGEHSDSDKDGDHLCDYGCEAIIESCSDKANDGNHNCDICGNADVSSHSYSEASCGAPATCSECGATTGSTLDHKDENHDHICDNGCNKTDLGDHSDSSEDADHLCDYGCKAILENCSDTETDDDHDCDVCGKKDITTHAHVENKDKATEATCNTAATKTYVCNCGHTYTEDDGAALGHNITGVTPIEREVSGCEYVLVYICLNENCDNKNKEVYGETVYHHDYIASISTPATCATNGEKTFKCSVCGDTGKDPEVIPADATGHNWITGEVVDGVRTDRCSVCEEEKTVTVYTGNKTDEVNAGDLADKEIELNDANISLDSGVIDTIGDQNVTVSADKLEGDDRKDLGLTKDQLVQVGTNPIYNFTINNGTENIAKFGDENYVTITLPYTLSEGEDIDSIAVWFINDKGELESIKATYNNGFVTFKTNHFSYYTVTRLKPAERCALYGHSYTCQHVEGSCTKDSYDLYVCVRCHDKYVDEDSLVIADGHDYSVDTYEATCTENGYVLYDCVDCDHAYRTNINATGHSWSEIGSGDVSCTVDGFVKYGCDNCDEEYTVTFPKTGHDYTDTVIPATCAADGYTVHDCKNCEYSYTDTYVEALGHSYEAGNWTWEANGNKATLTLVCEHDDTHVTSLHVISTMQKEVGKGACSNYVIRTHTATVEYNGKTYTDVFVIRQGNPTHKFPSEWTWDEQMHWHECICGAKEDIAQHFYQKATTTKFPTCAEDGERIVYCECGAYKTVVLPATGEHNYENGVCTECGTEHVDAYYLNLINSWKNMDGFAIRIQNLSYEAKRKNDSISGAFEMIGSIKQVDIAELALYLEDGELNGAAIGCIEIFNGPIANATAVYSFKAIIRNEHVYVNVKYGKEGAEKNIDLKVSLDAAIRSILEEADFEEETTDALKFLADKMVPAINAFVEANSEDINSVLESIFNIVFTLEKQEDGSFVAFLDYNKLYALNDNLATKPVSEVVDIYFGEGTFDSLVEFAFEILDLTIPDIPAYVEKFGFDFDEIVTTINELAAMSGAPDDFDFGAIFTSEEYANVTLGMLMFEVEDSSYADKVNEIIAVLREKSVYGFYSPEPEELQKMIANIIDIIDQDVSVSFTTDGSGMLASVDIDCENFSYTEGDNRADISLNVQLTVNERVDVTWSDIIDIIDDNITLPHPDMLSESIRANYHYGFNGYLTYQGEEYYFTNGILFDAYQAVYDSVYGVMSTPDCNGWIEYSVAYGRRQYEFMLAMITVDGESIMLIVDQYSNEAVQLVQTETGFTAIYNDGTEKEIEFNAEVGFDNIAVAYTNIYLAVFENPEGNFIPFGSSVEYYYNPELNEYSYESHHVLKYEYEVEGDSCDAGHCTVYISCENCDFTDERREYNCDYEERVTIDLSEYTTCGGTAVVDRCTVCGNIGYIYDMSINCELSTPEEQDIIDENGNVIGKKYVYTCAKCDLTFVEQDWVEVHTSCEHTEYNGSYIYKGDECILSYVDREYRIGHQYEYSYGFEGNGCEDGYFVTRYCSVCGENERYHDWGHNTSWKTIDLSELGLCGGHIEEQYCSVCNKVLNAYVNTNCRWQHTGTDEDGYEVYTCRNCGAVRHTYSFNSEKDEHCNYVHVENNIYSLNGEEIYKVEQSYTSVSHNYKHDFEMSGDSCEDGYAHTTTCQDCGETWTEHRNDHNIFEEFRLSNVEGACEKHYLVVRSCPCGHDYYIDFESNGTHYDEESNTYTCDTCGLFYEKSVASVEEGCVEYETTTVTIALGSEILYTQKYEKLYSNHSFNNVDVIQIDGKTHLSSTCDKCNELISTEILQGNAEYHSNNGQYYYDYYFTPSVSAIYSIMGLSDRDTYVTLYMMQDGELIEIARNDDGSYNSQFLLSVYLNADATYVYRIGFYGYDEEGVIGFTFTAKQSNVGGCKHRASIRFATLLNDASTCVEGVLTGYIHSGCGCISNIRTEYDHRMMQKETIDLEQYGACGGSFVYEACACGKENRIYLQDSCFDNGTDNEYYDEERKLICVQTRSCSKCGLRYDCSYYTVRDLENCLNTYYYTVTISIGGTLVADTEYVIASTEHDYTITGSLINGEGSSCEDGAIINYTCNYCDHSYSQETNAHETYAKEIIDLAGLGSVCGGYATVYGCVCEAYGHLSIDHSLCDFGGYWCENWIEDAITESQYNIDNFNYRDSLWNEFRIYKCAVTDPEDAACAYKIRYAYYWKKENPNDCIAYRYETWQFNYNEETGEFDYEVTFKTGDSMLYHDYVDSSTDNCTTLDCEDCGSYFYINNYYNSNGDHIKYERKANHTLEDNRNKYREETYEYATDSEGNSYICREYQKSIYFNGEEYWYQRLSEETPYNGPFGDGGRRVKSIYTDSYGERSEQDRAYVWYKNYSFDIFNYRTDAHGYWYKYNYSYTFTDGCVRTTSYENSNGESWTSSENICKFYRDITIKPSTCSQEGEECDECVICGKHTESYPVAPNDHNWIQIHDNWYYCFTCGLENANGASGSIIMEDLTEAYGNGEYYVIGYYARNQVEFSQYVSLYFADGTEIIVDGIDFITIDGICAVAFSKVAVEAYATEHGYTNYNVRFAFVPYGADSSFDYAITFTETIDIGNISDDVSFKDYIGEGETKSYTITPTEDGVWTFTSAAGRDTYGYLYSSSGNCVCMDDDSGYENNFRIDYELKAGETYTVVVRWYSDDVAGNMILLFNRQV